MASFRAGVLTISDTAASDPSADRSGALLAEQLGQAGYTVTRSVCADDVVQIREHVRRMVDDEGLELVVTSGGTGFGRRDVTPEALAPLITRPTPALTHALTAHSLAKTPLAALSRSITGVRKSEARDADALLVALPGSPKAVKECLELLLANGLLSHALELLAGGSGEDRHRQMQAGLHRSTLATATDTGHAHSHHHHHHHHHHNHSGGAGLHSHSAPKPRTTAAEHAGFRTVDPAAGPSLRHRVSPYPLVPLDDALALIATHTPHASTVETLPLGSALTGHVLAEDVVAQQDLPPGATTNVDGYAVHAASTPAGDYAVVTLKTLQQRALRAGEVFRINTGQGLPHGTDAVVMVEDTELLTAHDGEELSVRVLAQVDAGENVRAKASDVAAGQVVLPRGTMLSALGGEIGTLAFLGRSSVEVYRKPRVALLSTGNELLDAGTTSSSAASAASWGFGVYDANRPGLHAAISGQGFEVIDLGIVGDDVGATLAALRRARDEADVIVTTGGTSMGESDLLKPLIERHLSAHIVFGRVAMKPGKPTTFATLAGGKLVFALPGNPASALVTFYLFVLPALRKLAGIRPVEADSAGANAWSLPLVDVALGSQMRLDPRPEFHRATLRNTPQQGLVATTTGNQRSSGMQSMSMANALIALPPLTSDSPSPTLAPGSAVKAMILGPIL